MSDFFEKVATDMSSLEKEYLGPDYKYYRFIRNPGQLGMSGSGSVSALSKDIAGIINYVQLLVSGEGPASSTGRPLGDKFFLKTAGQCKDVKTGKKVARSMYINNVPTGNINFIPAMPGLNVGSSFRGIIPGILNDLGDINPLAMFGAFMQGTSPPCAEVTLETIDENSRSSRGSAYVPINELQQLQSSGSIPKNTVTAQMLQEMKESSNTKETFTDFCNSCVGKQKKSTTVLKQTDMMTNVYYTGFALVLVYILYRYMKKNKD